jgi:hypothetical protein
VVYFNSADDLNLEGAICAGQFLLSTCLMNLIFADGLGIFERNYLRSKYCIFPPILMIDREIDEHFKSINLKHLLLSSAACKV